MATTKERDFTFLVDFGKEKEKFDDDQMGNEHNLEKWKQ